MRLLITGCPGSGKGTLSTKIVHAFPRIKTLSSGDLFRKHIQQRTELGKQVESILASGELVSDELTVDLVLSEMGKLSSFKDSITMLDGFPRTLPQATLLDKHLESLQQPLDIVLNLDVPHSVILKRVVDRWIHSASGRTYNLSYNPPKVPGLDDVTGEPLSKRPDDNLEIFKNRLENYVEQTEPLLDYYKRQNKLLNFKGETSDQIFPHIQAELSKRLR